MKLVSQLHTLTQITYSILSIYVLPPTDFNGKYVIINTETTSKNKSLSFKISK